MDKKITILIPCLDEEKVITDVIKDCWVGLKNDRSHQILIIDSGNDKSGEIATSLGADVVRTPRRGLGQAYIDAIPYIKGDYLIVGDADGTYDYKELAKFVEKLDQGYQFIMGSRMKGWIEKDAMPKLHQYFGSPITNWILNLIYRSKFSDIHCGMRAMTKEAFVKMDLQSRSWEYASEMIIKALHMNLKTAEVPIHFYKDKNGRISHVKRQGWMTPWQAGWVSLRAMFIHGADFFLYKPGAALFFMGFFTVLILSFGPIYFLSLYFMLLAMSLAILGYVAFIMGILAKIIYDYSREEANKYLKIYNYNKSFIFSSVLFVVGISLTLFLVTDYIGYGYKLTDGIKDSYYASVTGLLLIIISFINFTFSLLLHALVERINKNSYEK